jgi:DNA-binding IscR family transcriptional regulator
VGTENVCVIQPGCKLRHVLAEAERRQVEYLSGVRLADVVNPGDYGPAVVSIAPSPPVSWCPPTEV